MEDRNLSLYVEDTSYIYRPARLDDATYTQVLEATVGYCVDAILVVDRSQGLIALPKRRALPYQGYWYIGGRVLPGEPETHALVRKFRQETGLALEPDRFEYVRAARYMWRRRAQVPQAVGCDMFGQIFLLELKLGELRRIIDGLDPQEYEPDGLRVFARPGLVEMDAHPSILDTYDAVFPIFNNDN